jgi:hypothetical protein
MLYGVQTSFGQLIGSETYQQLAAFGYTMARIDAQACTPEEAALLAQEAVEAGLTPLVILQHPDQMRDLPEGTHVEVLNEPDITDVSAGVYLVLMLAFAGAVRDGIHLWGPCVSNRNRRGLNYLHQIAHLFPARVGITLHSYQYGAYPYAPFPGAASRDDEVAQLTAIIGDRPFGISETGFHTCPMPTYGDWRKNLPWLTTRHTDDHVADLLNWECAFWNRHGAAFCCIFQIDDGPTDTPEHRFGIRRVDGTWKPAAQR